jgi:hypothetical protein
VHLSDGAHFENLALYELVRRQCRYILVSDCGADPDVAFDDFGTLIRRVRQDFGAEIDIDLRPLRPGAAGRAGQHVVAGSVHYPSGDTGVLLYVKPAIVGDEPPDVAQYRARNPQFPHETTADQFYDEAQWESYRRLGVHTARAAFLGPMPAPRPRVDGARRGRARGRARRDARAGGCDDGRDGGRGRVGGRRRRRAARRARVHARAPPVASGARRLPRPRTRARGAVRRARRRALRGGAARRRRHAASGRPRVGRPRAHLLLGARRCVARAPRPAHRVLEDAVPLIRRAALCMEEAYHAEGLAYHSRHPVYLGTLNYFARWARLPAMRFWWPVLRALHAPAFVAWAEKEFRLPGPAGDPNVEGTLHYRLAEREFRPAAEQSYVERCWREGDRRAHDGRDTRLELTAALPWGDGAVEVAVGQLLVRHADAHAGAHAAAHADAYASPHAGARAAARRVAVFDADWLFVPMGLWGVGTGEALLARCRHARADLLAWADGLLVRVPATPRFGLVGRRASAATTQLFRGQGFLEVYADADGLVQVPADCGGPLAIPRRRCSATRARPRAGCTVPCTPRRPTPRRPAPPRRRRRAARLRRRSPPERLPRRTAAHGSPRAAPQRTAPEPPARAHLAPPRVAPPRVAPPRVAPPPGRTDRGLRGPRALGGCGGPARPLGRGAGGRGRPDALPAAGRRASVRHARPPPPPGPEAGSVLIGVAGMVGAGKSTLARALGARFGLQLAPESVADNPWLAPYYAGGAASRRAYALRLQLHFLATRFESMRHIRGRAAAGCSTARGTRTPRCSRAGCGRTA